MFTARSEAPAASMLVETLYKAIVECDDPKHIEYAEALLVLSYMHSEYSSARSRGDAKISESFVAESGFDSLFVGSLDYMVEKRRNDPAAVRQIHSRCSALYTRLRRVANRFPSDPSQKSRDVKVLMDSLRSNCNLDGSDPFSIIGYDLKFRP